MPTSQRMGWPYPAENQDPFFASFESMIKAQDTSVYATREDRNVLLMAGGLVAFTASTGLLTWSLPIEMNSAVTGFKWSIPAGNVSILDGQYLFVRLARNPISNTVLTVEVASVLPGNDPDNTFIIALRNGNRVYFRDGHVLLDGTSVLLFSAPPSGTGGVGTPGQAFRQSLTLATSDSANSGTPKVMGSLALDSDDYTLNGTAKTFEFCVVANVDGAGVTGEVKLYNLTAAADAAVLTFAGLTSPTKQLIAATISNADDLYEVRGVITAGVGTLYVAWAGIRISNTIS